jgi:GTP cyclohydrolase II
MTPIETTVRSDDGELVRYLSDRLVPAAGGDPRAPVPSVTLSYAQSLDGSIAAERGKPLKLSNHQSQALTHQLRAWHDGVLVGINTVLSDDPQLTVRLVPGNSPQPIVLDSRLRFPPSARLLRPPCVPPIIATTTDACVRREAQLREAGATIVRVRSLRGGFIDLRDLLARLDALGIRSLMVEGGAHVITSFLASNIVDKLIVTIVPQVVGGLPAITPFSAAMRSPFRNILTNVRYHSFAGDLVVFAELCRPAHESEDESTNRADAEIVGGPIN